MRILVLGGSGFLSGRFVRYALEAGHELMCVTRGARPLDVRVAWHVVSERDALTVELFKGHPYELVIDFIGMQAGHAQQSVELARTCGRLIFISSDYVYHPAHRTLFLREDQAVFSDFVDYGGAKRQAERVIEQAAGTVRAIIARPPHIYGTGSFPGTIPQQGRRPDLLERLRREEPLRLLQGGSGLIQPIHVEDLARILVQLMTNERAYDQAITMAGPRLMTHLEYYQTLAELVGHPLRVVPYCPEGAAPEWSFRGIRLHAVPAGNGRVGGPIGYPGEWLIQANGSRLGLRQSDRLLGACRIPDPAVAGDH
ncbi:MAG: NAD-dependent epimerase/dehydratase family protein [Magnetococcus sp. YQC-9]